MDSKPVSSNPGHSHSLASRLLFFVNQRRLKVWFRRCAIVLIIVACGYIEIRTSALQSWIFTSTNERLSFDLAAGRSSSIAFPRAAPLDERRGYSKLASFQSRLEAQGYQVTLQIKQSETTVNFINHGISPPYVALPNAGIDIRGLDGARLFRYAQSEFLFQKIDEIPPLLVQTLLFLENRDLGRPSTPWQNPAIE
jgi:hypothetical protein